MPSNRELLTLKKADMLLSDLAAGGQLLPEQEGRFIRTILDTPTILNAARQVVMTGSKREINKIGIGSRMLRPANPGADTGSRALTKSQRIKPDTSKIELETSKVLATVYLPYDIFQENIERGNLNLAGAASAPQPVTGGLVNTLIDLIAERAAYDLEELGLNGDTGSGDEYLALCDGYLKLAAGDGGNIVNVGDVIGRDMFAAGIKTMPRKYVRNRAVLRNYISHVNETDYRSLLADRETTMGDAMVRGNNPMFAHGVRVESAAEMPDAKGLMTNPSNLLFGIQQDISLEVDKDIEEQVFIIVVSAKVAFQIEEVDATVLYQNIVTS